MTSQEIGTVAQNAGFTGSDLVTAVAIALAESGGNPNELGDTGIGSGTGSFGLWQINADAHPEYGPNFAQLYDPQTNANAAYAIYIDAGASFSPWTTFKTGSYTGFVTSVEVSIAALLSGDANATAGIVLLAVLGFLFFLRRA